MEYGFIAYCGSSILWFEGPLPSWRSAHTLVQLYLGIDRVTVTPRHERAVAAIWNFKGQKPDDDLSVKWAVELTGPVPTSSNSAALLRTIDASLGTSHRIGPGPASDVSSDKWKDGLHVPFSDEVLTLHEGVFTRVGPVYKSGTVSIYMVGHLPKGDEAEIANFASSNQNDWRVYRTKGGEGSGWTGSYESAEAALAVLQREYDEILVTTENPQ